MKALHCSLSLLGAALPASASPPDQHNTITVSMGDLGGSDPACRGGEDLSDTLLGKTAASRQAPLFSPHPTDRPGEATAVAPAVAPAVAGADAAVAARPPGQFVNPIAEGADPWVTRNPRGGYLWCSSEGNRAIAIHSGPRLTALGRKHIVWRAPKKGPLSREVWAPELHFLDGKWHIYFAASDGRNENHLAYVLVSAGDDPLGPYTARGPFETGDQPGKPVWAIDMTVLGHGGKRYALWSGWDVPGSDRQFLYIAPMKSPTELAGPRVRLCANDDFPWEFTEGPRRGRGLNEAPQVLQTGRRTFVMFSCGASWLPTYQLGRLELTGDAPLDPRSWVKHDQPVFTSSDSTWGVGHSCFVRSPDGTQWWHVYHAKQDREPGWRRGIFVQPMAIDPRGLPLFGRPVAPGQPLDRPAGEPPLPAARLPFVSTLTAGAPDATNWMPCGHHHFTCKGPAIAVFHNGRRALAAQDRDHPAGQAGLRVVDTHAVFTALRIE